MSRPGSLLATAGAQTASSQIQAAPAGESGARAVARDAAGDREDVFVRPFVLAPDIHGRRHIWPVVVS
jgi:hypothetical protein